MSQRPRHERKKEVRALEVVVVVVEHAGRVGEEASGNLSHVKWKTWDSGNPQIQKPTPSGAQSGVPKKTSTAG